MAHNPEKYLYDIQDSCQFLIEFCRGHTRIIGFRHILVHGYDALNYDVVWAVVQNKIPEILEDTSKLLKQADNPE